LGDFASRDVGLFYLFGKVQEVVADSGYPFIWHRGHIPVGIVKVWAAACSLFCPKANRHRAVRYIFFAATAGPEPSKKGCRFHPCCVTIFITL